VWDNNDGGSSFGLLVIGNRCPPFEFLESERSQSQQIVILSLACHFLFS